MYGKIFDSIYDGTISADWKAMITFQQFIVLADQDGIVDMTPPALSRRTGIPLDVIEHGIEKLLETDPYSRNEAHQGRRLLLLDEHRNWGYRITNYEHYKNLATREEKRAYDKERYKVKKSEKGGGKVEKSNISQVSTDSTYVDTDTDIDIKKHTCRFEEIWSAHPIKKGDKNRALAKWKARGHDRIADQILEKLKKQIEHDQDWRAGYAPQAATYLNGERWNDEINTKRSNGNTGNAQDRAMHATKQWLERKQRASS